MNKETLNALKGSIRKWEKIVNRTGVDNGKDNCPLCELFYKKNCVGCPVFEKTGEFGCIGSPYLEWTEHHEKRHEWEEYLVVLCLECWEIAERELKFLKSLLPEEECERK